MIDAVHIMLMLCLLNNSHILHRIIPISISTYIGGVTIHLSRVIIHIMRDIGHGGHVPIRWSWWYGTSVEQWWNITIYYGILLVPRRVIWHIWMLFMTRGRPLQLSWCGEIYVLWRRYLGMVGSLTIGWREVCCVVFINDARPNNVNVCLLTS